MRPPAAEVLVIGAGVIGLTAALIMVSAGLQVHIWAADPPLATASAASGAMWAPYPMEPADRVRIWLARTRDWLVWLAGQPDAGVRLVGGIEATRIPLPSAWPEQPAQVRRCERDELPRNFVDGYRFTAPMIDMPVYLTYLQRRLIDAGTGIEVRHVESLAEAAACGPVVVNCAGVGACRLVPDPDVTPVRGQLVVVENPGLTDFFVEDTGLSMQQCYIYPHGRTVVLGGVAAPGQWSLEPDDAVAAGILQRCIEVEPSLRGARIIGHRVGLRPSRPQVRLAEDRIGRTRLIHNYGHGRAGVSLSWGCAEEVFRMLSTLRDDAHGGRV
jgi:D-amino-acid oxidase